MLKRPGFPISDDVTNSPVESVGRTTASLLHSEPVMGTTKNGWTITGHLVPVLQLDIGDRHASVCFEPHDVLWKDDTVTVGLKSEGGILGTLGGMLKRSVAGVNVLLAQASGRGKIALSRGEAGCISAIPMEKGHRVVVHQGSFLAATAGISCGFERVQGIGNILLGGSGFFVGTFQAEHDGTLFVHGLGDLFTMELDAYQSIEVSQHGWLWKDGALDMTTVSTSLGSAIMGSGSILMHRFTGPGRLCVQSGRRPSNPEAVKLT